MRPTVAQTVLVQLPTGASDKGCAKGRGLLRESLSREWQAMVAGAAGTLCTPTLTNDAGNDCWSPACVTAGACSFSGVAVAGGGLYWSSTTNAGTPTNAWYVDLGIGGFGQTAKTLDFHVWPVRGGQ